MKIISLKPGVLSLFVLWASLFFSVSVTAQSVQTRVSTDSLTIGDTFKLSLILQLDREYLKVEFPDTNSFPPSTELIQRQQFKISEFSDSLTYNLQFFGNEDLQISSLPVRLYSSNDTTVIYTDPILLNFKTVVAEGDTSLKAMKPIYEFPRMWWPWFLAGLLIAGFLLWWYKFREEPEIIETEPEHEIKPFYDPIKELEKTLVYIKKDSNVVESKNFKLFYSQIGDAIRTYFEELYKIPALESTSNELLRYLEAYGVDETMTEKTRVVLRKADLVKFAKFTPTLEDAWKTHDHAIEFMERAKLADAARVSRLKAKYNKQFKPTPEQQKSEEA